MMQNGRRPPRNEGGPGGDANTAPARKAVTKGNLIAIAGSVQFKSPPLSEAQLCAAGWSDPVELVRVADACKLGIHDFTDRLCGALAGYLRIIGEQGRTPGIAEAEYFARQRGVCMSPGEIASIVETPIPRGDVIVDLVRDVQRGADERNGQICRELARDGLRTLHHAFNCPRCIVCARGGCDRSVEPTRKRPARRVVYA